MGMRRSCGQQALSAAPATCQSQSCRWLSISGALVVTTTTPWAHRHTCGPATAMRESVKCRDESQCAECQDLPKGCYSQGSQVWAKVSLRCKRRTAKTSKSVSCTQPQRSAGPLRRWRDMRHVRLGAYMHVCVRIHMQHMHRVNLI